MSGAAARVQGRATARPLGCAATLRAAHCAFRGCPGQRRRVRSAHALAVPRRSVPRFRACEYLPVRVLLAVPAVARVRGQVGLRKHSDRLHSPATVQPTGSARLLCVKADLRLLRVLLHELHRLRVAHARDVGGDDDDDDRLVTPVQRSDIGSDRFGAVCQCRRARLFAADMPCHAGGRAGGRGYHCGTPRGKQGTRCRTARPPRSIPHNATRVPPAHARLRHPTRR